MLVTSDPLGNRILAVSPIFPKCPYFIDFAHPCAVTVLDPVLNRPVEYMAIPGIRQTQACHI